MKKWLIGLTLLLLLATGMVGLAQDIPVFCGDLSAADCTLLKDSEAVMQSVHSTTFALASTLKIQNIPDVPVGSLEFHLKGAGSLAGGTSTLPNFMLPGAETSIASFFKLMADVMRQVKGDMTLSFELPADLAKVTKDVKLPQEIGLDFRMVDGVAYVNLEQFAVINPKVGIPAGWVGVDVSELYGEIMPQQFSGTAASAFDMTAMTGMIGEMVKPENVAKFMTIERLPDAEIAGQKVAVFHTTIDYQAMFDIEAFRTMMQGFMTGAGASAKEVEEAISMMREMYKGMAIDITESIGIDDKRVYSTEITFGWDMSAMPGVEAGAAPQLNMNMVIDTTDFDKDFTVEVPDNAMLLPLKSMLLQQ